MSAGGLRARVASVFDRDRSLILGVAGVGMLKAGSMLAAILITVLLARILGPSAFGGYAFAFSMASLLTLPILQGVPVLVVREVAREVPDRRPGLSATLLRFSDRLGLAAGLLISGALAVSMALGIAAPLGDDPLLLICAIALPLVMVATLVRGSVIRAWGRAVAGQVPDMIVRPVLLLVFLLGLVLVPQPTAGIAMALHLLAAVAACATAAWLLARHAPDHVAGADAARMPVGTWLRTLVPLSTVAGMQLINSQVDLVLLGFLSSAEDVGIYRVATTLALQVSFVLTVVNAVAAPKFAHLYREGRIDEMRRVNRIGAAVAFAVGAVIFAIYAEFGRSIISLAVGPAYQGAFIPLLILSGAHLLTLWAGTTNVLLNMIGRERDVMVAAVLATAVNIALNLVLISRLGIVGAACSSAGALMVWRIALSLYLRRRLAAPTGES